MFSIIPVIYPVISVLPFIMFFYYKFSSYLYIKELYPICLALLIAIFTPIFKYYSRHNKHTYENQLRIDTTNIMLISICVSVAVPLMLLESKVYIFALALPFFAAMYFNFILCAIFYLKDDSSDGVLAAVNLHLQKTITTIYITVIVKVFLIALFVLSDFWMNFLFIPSVLSFIADISLIAYLRKLIYQSFLRSEGPSRDQKYKQRRLLPGGIILFSIIISILISRSWSLFSYKYINIFLLWLSDLGAVNNSEIRIDQSDPFANMKGDIEELVGLSDGVGDPGLVQDLILVMGWIGVVIIVSFLSYLLFKPIIVPLFSRNKEKISLKEYYKSILRNIVNFFSSLFMGRSKEGTVKERRVSGPGKKRVVFRKDDIRKKRETKKLLRLYLGLLKIARKKIDSLKNRNISTDDLFNSIPVKESRDIEHISGLNRLFKKGFYSENVLTDSEFKELKLKLNKVVKLVNKL